MATPQSRKRKARRLPAKLRELFWDYDFAKLSWKHDFDLVVSRILSSGTWDQICWLRKRMNDDDLRQWIAHRQGRGLSPRQLRFWELILGLPRRKVNQWLAEGDRWIWDRRVKR
jgi:hypothetical protein